MRCRIEDCNHRVQKTTSETHHVGQSWYDHRICSCCAITCIELDIVFGYYHVSQTCLRLIKEELLATTKIDQLIPNS